jgi:hypothetical protein
MAARRRLIFALIFSLSTHFIFLMFAREFRHGPVNGSKPLLVQIKAAEVVPQPAALLPERSSPLNKSEAVAAAAPRYLGHGELTEQPSLIDELPEVVTGPSQDTRNVKSADLRLVIGADGRALYLQVLRSTLPLAVEEQVVRAFYHASYRPGRVGSRAVNAEMLVSVNLE